MRLERLEISGFKSFSDRSELAFDRGVTAIVGPNGCGKSNVADAITWVLGEQSAKSLRGEKMEDVIFNGSDARKPGATAEVRLRLSGLALPPKMVTHPGDEPVPAPVGSAPGQEFRVTEASGHTNGHGSDGNGQANGHHATDQAAHAEAQASFVDEMAQVFSRDVDVTRRLYRSGESEYLIDGEVCRLRDVHELLMDTGLGAKAYSIIEQGKIGMILSTRPADRRSLIEEAAGITKYKSRRRAAELKLEAAQQNLTRVDDIVFEVEKQRGTLKRQAAKARRYRKLREELYRWEKVLFARRYRELAAVIESSRTRLADARERETAAGARLAEVESDLGRLRIEQAEADSRASAIREDAHGRELDINRRQQQQEFNRHQAESLLARVDQLGDEVRDLEERREPARQAIELRREAALEAARSREEAAATLADATASFGTAQRQIEGLEGDVERARGLLFGVINSATAVQHAMQHAASQRERVGATLARLEVELSDVAREAEALEVEKASAGETLTRALDELDAMKAERTAREADLVTARADHEWRARSVRTREQEIAGIEARLASLEELATSRAEFSDAARMVLVQANGRVGQLGAVADYVEVDGRYERAVEACLGDLLQHVIVERHEQAEAGLALVREQKAGRCGFVILDADQHSEAAAAPQANPAVVRGTVRPIADILSISGTYAATVRQVLPEAYVAETLDQARDAARHTGAPIATVDGDVVRGLHLVSGGSKGEARGILATRREIKELQERLVSEREGLATLLDEVTTLEGRISDLTGTIAAHQAEQHRIEKSLVGLEGQMARLADEAIRQSRKAEVVGRERRQAEDERQQLDARYEQAQESLERLDGEKLEAEQALGDAQRALSAARGTVDELSAHAAEARAAHAALMERAAALASEVLRLEEGARDLEDRLTARSREREQVQARRESLLAGVAGESDALDEAIRALESLREALRGADDAAAALRVAVDTQEALIRAARASLDAVRKEASELDLVRVTGESDLSHLAQTCTDAVQCSLEEVLAEVEELERTGQAEPDAAAIAAAENAEPDADESEAAEAAVAAEAPADAPVAGSITAEEAIVRLKQRIDRLGPVNMMAIEQYDELETRHTFLTTQRKDLVDSIAQTSEAIHRIDETSKTRFREAFAAIQVNFANTFSTLFGGGRAGLTLLDENDPLESGIEIVASPPGKRLQSVQLLSGGEKALTAIALMFAIFKYKPSPFCLLDEIDAPLDDANVGRFVEMLRGMLGHTQFILITHNRRTMEIANRLYGVTMEEPGVSKLISVQLH